MFIWIHGLLLFFLACIWRPACAIHSFIWFCQRNLIWKSYVFCTEGCKALLLFFFSFIRLLPLPTTTKTMAGKEIGQKYRIEAYGVCNIAFFDSDKNRENKSGWGSAIRMQKIGPTECNSQSKSCTRSLRHRIAYKLYNNTAGWKSRVESLKISN